MALIYTKLSEKTTVLAPRQGAGRKFNFGDDWTEIRVGMFYSGVAASGSNTNNVNETVAVSTVLDRITFGIKDDSQTIPGQTGSLFLGAVTRTGLTSDSQAPGSFGFFRSGGGGDVSAAGYNGTSIIGGTGTEALGQALGFGAASLSSAYNGFLCLKFVITNRGLSSQSVAISMNNDAQGSIAGTDYSANALRTAINNATFLTAKNIAWNDGVSAYDIPDLVWVRMPFYNNCIRISAIRAIRYAPV